VSPDHDLLHELPPWLVLPLLYPRDLPAPLLERQRRSVDPILRLRLGCLTRFLDDWCLLRNDGMSPSFLITKIRDVLGLGLLVRESPVQNDLSFR